MISHNLQYLLRLPAPTRRPRHYVLDALVLLCIHCLGLVASAQFRSTQWTADSGLPQTAVRGLVQRADGYLWVATTDGLARFDGVRFEIFNKSTSPGITSDQFGSMVKGAGADFWLASEDGNLVRFDGSLFTTMGEKTGIKPHSVTAITANIDGNVWADSGGVVVRWDRTAQTFRPERFSTHDLQFRSLRWPGTGFWALSGKDILCFNRGRLFRYPLPMNVLASNIRGVVANNNGQSWIGTKDGRLGLLGTKKVALSRRAQTYLLQGPQDADWRIDISPHQFERRLHLIADGADHAVTLDVMQPDYEGNVWVGGEEGLFRIRRQSINTMSKQQGLANDNVYPVFASHSGDIWVGSWPSGLSQLHQGKVVRVYEKQSGLPGLVTSLAEAKDGTLWIGTHGGIRLLVNGHIEKPILPAPIYSVAQVIHQAPDGAMLVGTPDGLYVLQNGRSRHLTAADGLASSDVRVIITDRNSNLWIGGYGGLTRLDGRGGLTRWTEKQGLPSDNIRCITEDASGDIWVGTYDGGIGWLRNGRWITFNKRLGLYDNGAFQILEDNLQRFWISSNRGIYRVDRRQLAAVSDGKESLVAAIAYGRDDGMLSAECNGGIWPAGTKDLQGRMWFPTQKGVAIVDPGKVFTVNEPPRMRIGSAAVDGIEQPSVTSVTLGPSQSNLVIDYTALSYSKPEQITFSYELDGVDSAWQEVGLRRTAYYTHLPPGQYAFHVSAKNSDGIRSKQDAVLHVVVIPPFYRRWWFVGCALAGIVIIFATMWRRRVAQFEATQTRQQLFSQQLIASQESERRRIAAELHDSLGQRLIVISNLSMLLLRAKGKVRTEEEKRETVQEISQEAAVAIEETRAISYALRPFQLDRLGLTRAIQALCTTVARSSDIKIRSELENIDFILADDLRINVYRIIQEGLSNIVKHSGATEVDLKTTLSANLLKVTLQDNGRGMPIKPHIPIPGQGGFGMVGIRERVTLLGGSFRVDSSPAIGTTLVIEVPLRADPKSLLENSVMEKDR